MKKYYIINLKTAPEVVEGYGGLLTPYGREIIYSLLSKSRDKLQEELSKISQAELEVFSKSLIRTAIYVDKLYHDKWVALPRKFKRPAQYLITQRLLEKLETLEKEGVI